MTIVKTVCAGDIEQLPLDAQIQQLPLDAELYSNELEAELPSGAVITEVGLSTWEKQTAEYGFGYHYTKPYYNGLTPNRTGDDIWVNNNIIVPAIIANGLKPKNVLVDHYTLLYPNEFGNYNRFTDSLGSNIYGNRYIMDLSADGTDGWWYSYNSCRHSAVTFDGGLVIQCLVNYIQTSSKYIRKYFNNKASKTCNITMQIYVPSSNVDLDRVAVQNYANYDYLGNTNGVKDQWVTISLNDYTSGASTFSELRFFAQNSSGNNSYYSSTTTDVFYVRDVDIHWYNEPAAIFNYIIDNYTGYAWPMDIPDFTVGGWDATIDRLLGTDYGGSNNRKGFTDWFMAGLQPINDVRRFDYNKAMSYPLFHYLNNGDLLQTSTNEPGSAIDANQIQWRNAVSHAGKSVTGYYAQYFRKHY